MSNTAAPVPIKNVLDPNAYADQMPVMCVRGTITKLYQAKTGEGGSGPYSFQNAELKDATGTIKVTFSSNEQPMSCKGKVVTIRAFKSDKHGWVGLKVEDREFEQNGEPKQERQLKVSGTAEIEYAGATTGGGGGGGGGNAANTKQPPAKANGGTDTAKPPRHPRLFLEDAVALYCDIVALVNEKFQDAHPEGAVSTLFIEAAKNGIVYDYKAQAAKPLPVKYPPTPTDPSEWRKCYIPSGELAGKTLEQISDEKLNALFDYYDGKGANTPLAECVYQAARDRGLLPPPEPPPAPPSDPDLDVPPDDIPF